MSTLLKIREEESERIATNKVLALKEMAKKEEEVEGETSLHQKPKEQNNQKHKHRPHDCYYLHPSFIIYLPIYSKFK